MIPKRNKKGPIREIGPEEHDGRESLSSASRPLQTGYTMPSFAFSTFSSPALARLLVALLKFEAPEKTIILDFFLQDFNGLFKVVIDDLDL